MWWYMVNPKKIKKKKIDRILWFKISDEYLYSYKLKIK